MTVYSHFNVFCYWQLTVYSHFNVFCYWQLTANSHFNVFWLLTVNFLIDIKSAFPIAKTAFSIANITSSVCVFLQSKISFFGKMRSWFWTASILIELLRNIFDLFTPNNRKRLRSHIVAIENTVSQFENHNTIGFLWVFVWTPWKISKL